MAQASMVEAQASASSSSFWALGMDVQIPPVFYRTSSPFGKGKGTDDHLLPLVNFWLISKSC